MHESPAQRVELDPPPIYESLIPVHAHEIDPGETSEITRRAMPGP